MTAKHRADNHARKFSFANHRLMIVDGVPVVRKTRVNTDANTGQPLDVWSTDHPLPPLSDWHAAAEEIENTPTEEENLI